VSSSFRRVCLRWSAPLVLVVQASAQSGPLAANVHDEPSSSESLRLRDVTEHAAPEAGASRGLSAEIEAGFSAASLYEPAAPVSDRVLIDDKGYYRNIYRRFYISGGVAAFADFNTNMQVTGDAGLGTDLDLEDLLNLDEDAVAARIDGRYAFNKRHWLEFAWYDIRRDGERTIANDITVGDVVIPASNVETTFDTAIFKIAYRYNFVAEPRTVIGASFGFHVMSIDSSFKSAAFAVEEEYKVDAPVPLLGLHGAYALSEKWKLSGSAEFLKFDIGDYRGLITDVRLTIDHDTFEHFGWGLGYNGFQSDATLEGEDGLKSDLEYGYSGLMVYLRLLF
jgi:hypothetical protein